MRSMKKRLEFSKYSSCKNEFDAKKYRLLPLLTREAIVYKRTSRGIKKRRYEKYRHLWRTETISLWRADNKLLLKVVITI